MLAQAVVLDDDIKMQGVSLRELLSKYFVPRQLGLLSEDYWTHFRGFEIKLHVSSLAGKCCLSCSPPCAASSHAQHQDVGIA